jgi:outer membrane protein OmpA-like peptidoglycan-associated protein
MAKTRRFDLVVEITKQVNVRSYGGQAMKHSKSLQLVLVTMAYVALSLTALAQQTQPSPAANVAKGQVSSGQKQTINGIIVRQENDSLSVRTPQGADYEIAINNFTKIKERKSNPFRGAKKYSVNDLLRGLNVEVEGRGNNENMLVADQIKFSETDLRTASSIVSLVKPVEGRVTATEDRMTLNEQNAQRISGQLDELASVANMANGGAKAAQEAADKAMLAANSANERITNTAQNLNNRISSLDDYEVAKTITLNFKVGSAVLSPEAKTTLDEIAAQSQTEKGYVIQVAGFASSDGNEVTNRRLSQRRAEAVMSYLIENHDISQRRIVTPLGYGEARPAADNTTRDGRKENRRVEVAILVNKGLTPATETTSSLNPPRQ